MVAPDGPSGGRAGGSGLYDPDRSPSDRDEGMVFRRGVRAYDGPVVLPNEKLR
jgi:hypothetical protein